MSVPVLSITPLIVKVLLLMMMKTPLLLCCMLYVNVGFASSSRTWSAVSDAGDSALRVIPETVSLSAWAALFPPEASRVADEISFGTIGVVHSSGSLCPFKHLGLQSNRLPQHEWFSK